MPWQLFWPDRRHGPRRPARRSVQGHVSSSLPTSHQAGSIHMNAQITGKAASMGEGVVSGVLDALINDFADKLGAL